MDNINFQLKTWDDTELDGPWVYSWLQVSSGTNTNYYTNLTAKYAHVFDLSSYLPSDDGTVDYEVLLSVWMWTNNTNGNNGTVWVFNGPDTGSRNMRISLCHARNRAASSSIQGTSCILPILAGKKQICFYNSANDLSSWGFQLSGYRRLGKNT